MGTWRAEGRFPHSPVFCAEEPSGLSLGYLLIGCTTVLSLFLIYYIIKHRKHIPVRQRAPIICAIHAVTNLMTMQVVVVIDLLLRFDIVYWGRQVPVGEVPFSRQFMKFLLNFFRLGITLLSIFR